MKSAAIFLRLIILTLSGLLFVAAGLSTSRAADTTTDNYNVTMKDGTRLVGTIQIKKVEFNASYGAVEVNLNDILTFNDGFLILNDGSKLKGNFASGNLGLETARGEMNLPFESITSITKSSTVTSTPSSAPPSTISPIVEKPNATSSANNNQQSQLSGLWINIRPDRSSGINYIVHTMNDPAGFISVEFLTESKMNVVRKLGESYINDFEIISEGRMEIGGALFSYQIIGGQLIFKDANGVTTIFTRQPGQLEPQIPKQSSASENLPTQEIADSVIAKGNGFEIKRSELDEVMTGMKSPAAVRGQTISPEQLSTIKKQMFDRLMQIQLLLQKATEADKTEGKKKADEQLTALLDRAGSQETLDRQLKAVGMTADELRSKVTQEATATAALTRELGVTVTDVQVKEFYDGHPSDFLDKKSRKLALTDKVPSTDMTVADKIKDYLTQQKTEKLAPPYLDNLGKNAGVEILDPDLK